MDYDIIVIGAGLAGAIAAIKCSKFAKTLLLDAHKGIETLPVKTNLFISHNQPFINDLDLNYNDRSIFSLEHIKSNFMSKKANGVINSEEFGDPLGHIIYTEKLLEKILRDFQDHGGHLKFNTNVSYVQNHSDYVKVKVDDNEYKGKLLMLATGSRGFNLQKSLGFETPDRYTGIYTNFSGSETQLKENIPWNYIFHINTKISDSGPFFINKGRERITLGFLGNFNENPAEIQDKLSRVIRNYSKIQPFLKGLKQEGEGIIVPISKHPISQFSQDRALILGEAAGLVTSFFYEGILGCVASADSAVKTVQQLFKEEKPLTRQHLRSYDQELNRILLKNFFNNGAASEYMFYNARSSMKLLWETYTELIRKNKTLRKYIYEAHLLKDLSKYDTSRDKWTGEKIFGSLPTLSKISLGPKFLKALFKL
ncbi:MAG: NAD(P)/FAD-dependent oxidoreductase [Promethearchaeia archaeon]